MTIFRLLFGYVLAVGAGLFVQRLRLENVLAPEVLASLKVGVPGGLKGVPAGGVENRRDGLKVIPAALPEEPESLEGWEGLLEPPSMKTKIRRVLRTATSDFLDVAFFFVIGAAIAAIFNTAVRQEVILPLATNDVFATLAMMVLASLLALCSTTDAFIAASFVAFPFAAKLAFLVFGPMVDVKLFFLYGMVFRRRFVVLLSLALFIAVALLSLRVAS